MTRTRAESSEQMESSDLQLRSIANDLRLATVADIARALSTSLSLEELLNLIMDRLTRALDADRSTLFLLSDDGTELWSTVAQGVEANGGHHTLRREIRIHKGQGLAGWVAATGRGVNVKDAHQDSRFDPHWDDAFDYRTRSMLCQPVFDSDGELIAVVQVLNKRHGWFTVEDESLLRTIMAMAAISIVNSQLNRIQVYQNVTLRDTQKQLAEKISEIDLLFDLEKQAAHAGSLDDLVNLMLQRIGAAVPVAVVQIALPTSTGGLVLHRLQTRRLGEVQLLVLDDVSGLSGTVLQDGVAADVCALDGRALTILAHAEQLPFVPQTGLCLPLQEGDQVIGALAVYDPPGRTQCLTEADAKLLTLISGQVARAVSQRQARELAEREDRLSAVGRALAGVMHDFRTPMTVASGYVQMLKHEEDADERDHLADDVLHQLERMMQMTREVLAFARGEQTVLMRKIQVAEFAREAEELVRQMFSGASTTVTVRCHYKGPARFDAGKLLRVVQNIARNSRDVLAHRSDGTFTMDLDADGDELVLTFADNGTGVPMAFRHRMFEPFATQGKKDGTGLGLAMVKQFAEAHGGGVTYRDTPGGGATFEIRIARDPQASVHALPAPAAVPVAEQIA